MTVSPISAVGSGLSDPTGALTGPSGTNLSQLAELYRQQVAGGTDLSSSISLDPTSAAGQAAATRGSNFASMIGGGLQNVENLDNSAATKAVQAATGDLTDVHDYVIAADKAQVATELTTTLRDKALDAFNEIMRMPL